MIIKKILFVSFLLLNFSYKSYSQEFPVKKPLESKLTKVKPSVRIIKGFLDIDVEGIEQDKEGNWALNYGIIKKGSNGERIIRIKNRKKTPFIIVNTSTSCGCTEPKYDKSPIPPNGSRELIIHYKKTDKLGKINQSVSINFRGRGKKEDQQIHFIVKGIVEP